MRNRTTPFSVSGFSMTMGALACALALLVAGNTRVDAADAAGALSAIATAAAPPAGSSAACLECHSDPDLRMTKAGKKILLFVDEKIPAASAHRSLECVDCHEKFDGDATPHLKPMVSVDCASCHEDTAKKHRFHARLALAPIPPGKDTSCVGCHGTHAVVPLKKTDFPFAAAAQAQACGQCHENAQAHFSSSAHGLALSSREAGAPTCLTCHKTSVVPPGTDDPTLAIKLAQTEQCASCHITNKDVASKALRGSGFVRSFDESVHGAALHAGRAESANCVDCHGAHEMNRAIAVSARVNKLHVAATCAKCHGKEAAEFDDGIHALALRKGNLDSPTCTNCHGEHDIRGHKDPSSPVHANNMARQVCATCHASLALTQKYGLASHTFQTFEDSYHGLAVRGGAVEVVNCASCHSAHAIKSQEDPASTVSKAHLVQTCGQCHPGANTRFTVGKVHVSPETAAGKDGGSAVLHLVSTLYGALIVVVVGSMLVHNSLDFLKKIRRKLAIQKGLIEEEHVAHRLFLRMTGHERVQHAVLVLSFCALVVTGFMLRYPESWWVTAIRRASTSAFEWRSLIHRIAGVVLLAAGAWHLGYLAFTRAGRSLFHALRPRWRDVTDPFAVLKYNLGLAPAKPAFPRFSYIEKVEYWALVWGTMLMGVTGAVLWFDNTSMGLFTKLGFDISRTIHFYEAILATLAILFWHVYFVVFNPDVYPMNLAWLTGRMSEKEMLEEHPLELARLKAEADAAKPPAAPEPETPPPPTQP